MAKVLRLQHTRNIMLKSHPEGQMDYAGLRETMRIHRDVPPIIFANIGTTMKGAVDDLAKIQERLDDLAIPNAYSPRRCCAQRDDSSLRGQATALGLR